MNKKFIIIFIITVLSGLLLLAIYQLIPLPRHKQDADGVSRITASQLRKDYLKFLKKEYPNYNYNETKIDDIFVQQYFGKLNGCDVVYMGSNLSYTTDMPSIIVAGYVITLPSGQDVYIHRKSSFYTIEEAYDKGYISKEDVYKIGVWVGISFIENNSNDV